MEVYVDTPLEVCEQRDPKGMYAQAREGQITGFTGIDDPYEPPNSPEIVLETTQTAAELNAQRILSYLIERSLVENFPPVEREMDEEWTRSYEGDGVKSLSFNI